MSALFQHCAETTLRLLSAVTALQSEATLLQVPALEGREWLEPIR